MSVGSLDGAGLLAVAAVLGLGAISPGASFVLVARLAVTRSRAAGVAAALGMGTGCAVFALAALLGLQAVLTRVPALHAALTLLGAAYLLGMAWRMWGRGRRSSVDSEDPSAAPPPRRSAFLLGAATQLSNPQTALVFAGVFAALLPAQRQLADYLVLPALAFAVDAGWFALVAGLLATAAPRALWLRARRPLERASALVMAVLGLRLARSLV